MIGSFMEVAPGVYAIPIGRGEFTGLFPPNVYLVTGERAILIDSGYEADAPARLERLKELGFRLSSILVTHPHPDHIGGALPIHRATGARVLLHQADAAEAGEVDGTLSEGETVGELEVIHTPGHSPGHACFFLRERGILFSGDHVLGLGTTVITPPKGNMGQYMASLSKLLAYPLKIICPGHGPVVREARRKVEELLQHRREREGQVLSCLERGRRRVEDMVKDIYEELDSRLFGLAELQVKAHLLKLMEEGRVMNKGEEFSLR